jgi:predicted nucleic acid-binding protein
LPAQKRKRPRGVVDTSVLVAGIAGLKSLEITLKNPSAKLLRDWIEGNTFVWLVSDDILLEYKRVLGRLGVRRPLIGKIGQSATRRGGTCPGLFSAKYLP